MCLLTSGLILTTYPTSSRQCKVRSGRSPKITHFTHFGHPQPFFPDICHTCHMTFGSHSHLLMLSKNPSSQSSSCGLSSMVSSSLALVKSNLKIVSPRPPQLVFHHCFTHHFVLPFILSKLPLLVPTLSTPSSLFLLVHQSNPMPLQKLTTSPALITACTIGICEELEFPYVLDSHFYCLFSFCFPHPYA